MNPKPKAKSHSPGHALIGCSDVVVNCGDKPQGVKEDGQPIPRYRACAVLTSLLSEGIIVHLTT
jgi:hypothetical protein